MTLAELATALTTQVQTHSKIVLDSSVLSAHTLSAISTSFLLDAKSNLTVDGVGVSDIHTDTSKGTIVVNAKSASASVLRLKSIPIELEFSLPATDVEVVIRATMSPQWTFKQSFPGLDLHPFNQLDFSASGTPAPQFVFTSSALPAFEWPSRSSESFPLTTSGMYFFSKIAFDHFTLVGKVLGNFISASPINLYGPFQPTAGQPLPVTKLSAPLLGSGTFSVGHAPNVLDLKKPVIAVQITESPSKQELQEIELLIESDIQNPAGANVLDISLSIPAKGSSIALQTKPVAADTSIAAVIEALPGGAEFLHYIPKEVDLFTDVGLDYFGLIVDTSAKVNSVGFEISTVGSWPIVKNELDLDKLILRILKVDPQGMNLTHVFIEAEADFLPHLFKGHFDFIVELEKSASATDPHWLVSTLSGTYFGVVNLGDLVNGLLGSANSAPKELRDIDFSEFSATATRTAIGSPWSYLFTAEAEATFPVQDTELAAQLYIGVVKEQAGFSVHLAGGLVFGQESFGLTLDLAKADTRLAGKWETSGSPFGFNDISKAVGLTLPSIPAGLDLGLTSAGLSYDFTDKAMAFDAVSANFGKASFATLKVNNSHQYSFQFDVGKTISLSDIPLVGHKLPSELKLAIEDLGLVFGSAKFDSAQVTQLNSLLGPPLKDATLFPAAGVAKGLNISATVQLGANSKTFSETITGGSKATAELVNDEFDSDEFDSDGFDSDGFDKDEFDNDEFDDDEFSDEHSDNFATDEQHDVVSSSLDATAPTTPNAPTTPSPPAEDKGSSSTKWINLQRKFGVFDFKRIGVAYKSGVLRFSLDAGIDAGPLTFSMTGLSIGSSIEHFHPSFNIAGLGLSYDKNPLEIEGSLLKKPADQLSADVSFQFDGTAVLKAGQFSLGAIGSYAQMTKGDPSLFVFAQLEAPLGGPPAFFITGVMVGFGFNRSISIPAQNEVSNFPLLVLGSPPTPGTNAPSASPDNVLQILEGQLPISNGGQKKQWIKPTSGDYWFAVGIEATSFDIVKTKAMLIVEFGHDLVFTLLGKSTLQLPQPSESSKTYAFVQLGIKAQLKPDDGYFGLSAVLSANSYVLTPACHLTGGFATYFWFGDNAYAGQFVICLGGYHPAFKPPSYYPAEPRLGFSWAVSRKVSISGGAYFALTPSCVMAGGNLDALFHDGNLRAWFTAYADFLVSWRPFFFTAGMGVSIGVSYRANLLFCHKTIKVSVSADLTLWGPSTGGKAHVHLWVVSFTVHFGSTGIASANEPLSWSGSNGFSHLLPPPKNICRITASEGMYKNLKNKPADQTNSEKLWVVRAQKFAFFTESVVPASELVYGSSAGNAPNKVSGAKLDIMPMDKTALTSQHALSVKQEVKPGSWVLHDMSGWTLTPRKANVPKSLWGTPPSSFSQIPSTPTADVISDALVGYQVSAPAPAIGGTLGVVPMSALAHDYLADGQAPISAAVVASPDYVPSTDPKSIAQIAKIQQAGGQRNALFDVLNKAQLYTGPNADLASIGTDAAHLYSAAPMVQV